MPTLTIPKSIIKENDLMIISRVEYENLVLKQRKIPTVKMTKAQKRNLEQARKEYAQGEYITLEELERELGTTPKRPG